VLERLRAQGCDMVQGHLLSRPLTVAEVRARVLGPVDIRDVTTGKPLRRVV
jgi:EAL domain-containing protein (putative c-di-GMP-specific phosphodiesterase class I)